MKFITYKTNDKLISFDQGFISVADLNGLLGCLDSIIPEGAELEFSIPNVNGSEDIYKMSNVTGLQIQQNGQIIEEKNFYQLILKTEHLVLDSNSFRARVIQLIAPDALELKTKIEALKVSVDPTLVTSKDTINKQIPEVKTQIESSLDVEQKDKYARLQELNSRLTAIQSQIEFYQNEKKVKEDLNNSIKKLTSEKSNIAQMLQSVELLINNREALVQKVNSYNGVAQTTEQIKDLKNRKINYLNTKLYSNKPVSSSINDSESSEKESKFKINFNVTVVFTILNIVITIIAFIYSYSPSVLIVGIIFSLILMVLYIISRFFKDSLEDLKSEEDLQEQVPAQKLNSPELEDPNTQLYINSAWANALKTELEVLDANIQRNLNGKSYETLKANQTSNEQALIQENQKLEEISKKSITSDEYYKKRRESDILKIEKENLEFGLKVDPALTEKLNNLSQSLLNVDKESELALKNSQILPVFVTGNVTKEQFPALKQNLLNQLVLVIAN